jgi:ribosomal protein L37AE/L43A
MQLRYYPSPMRRVLGLFVYVPDRVCPRCGSTHVHRTKRGRVFEFWVLLFVPVRPYRCGKCRLRFYGPKYLPRDPSLDDEMDS